VPTLAQISAQIAAPSAPAPAASANYASGGASTGGGGGRAVPAQRANVRPEAAAGLDGWLVDRLFGR
jgi:penicillin-binding protein 1A